VKKRHERGSAASGSKLVGVKTNIVTSVEVSDGYAHDYPFYKGLVDRTAALCYEITVELSSIQYVLAFRRWMEDVLFHLAARLWRRVLSYCNPLWRKVE
jgi:hypothetical protein